MRYLSVPCCCLPDGFQLRRSWENRRLNILNVLAEDVKATPVTQALSSIKMNGMLQRYSQLKKSQPSALPCLEKVGPQRAPQKPTPHKYFPGEYPVKRIFSMASVCRWELPLQNCYRWEGEWLHASIWLFSFCFSCLFKLLPPEHTYCNYNFIDLGANEATKGKILLLPYILKSSWCKPSPSPSGLFSEIPLLTASPLFFDFNMHAFELQFFSFAA